MKQGQLSLRVSTTATAVRVVHPSHCPDIGPICEVRDEPPQQHDQMFYVSELRPIVEYQVLPRVGVELQLPVRVSATTVRYLRLDGTPFVPDYENIHHRNETLVGLGDPWLSARTSFELAGVAFVGRVGLTVPLGRTEPDPFALGEQGLEHQHVQFGTGTVNPLLGLDVARSLGPVELRGYVQAQLSLYENHHGYLAGARVLGGVEAGGRIVGALRLAGSFDVFSEQPERWHGEIQQDGNLGRTDLLLGASVSYPLGGWELNAGVKLPVYQHLIEAGPHSGQLSYPAIVNFSVGRTFGFTPGR